MGTGNIETLLRFGTLRAQSKDMCHKLISNITRFTSVKTETGVHHHHHHLDLTRPPPAPIAPPPFWSRSPPRSARHADERCGCGSPLLARGPLLPSSARFRPVSAGLRATSNNQNGSSLNSNVPPEQLFFPMGGGIFQLYMGQALKMDDTQKRKPKLTEKMMITLILVVLCFFQTNPNITCCFFLPLYTQRSLLEPHGYIPVIPSEVPIVSLFMAGLWLVFVPLLVINLHKYPQFIQIICMFHVITHPDSWWCIALRPIMDGYPCLIHDTPVCHGQVTWWIGPLVIPSWIVFNSPNNGYINPYWWRDEHLL